MTPVDVIRDAFAGFQDEVFTVLPIAIGGLVVFLAVRVGLRYIRWSVEHAMFANDRETRWDDEWDEDEWERRGWRQMRDDERF